MECYQDSYGHFSLYGAFSEAVGRFQHGDIVGIVAEGRTGLGSYGRVPWPKADNETSWKMIQEEVRKFNLKEKEDV